ncbi:MogA/MoaB family molybdenum cofactor biosynthesis protein [Egibacter rhizosphaerae]|uniref:MogA/MoaB family molybdenum cofactor biosynthesis protein n=1 Tax=Egibacter rhizosphaerae TaxID=1670831 RepID=A0A411YJ35_9ACTN|nr:MogA/MoaB family molybdenum cofactor biosynthesis protein [Egibacter rhizosphaerae]QBI21092.1 MogA/MoaB family molybdenum cofactor biosynthesis protein [Egibacter rhizosphaerae]
MTPGEAGNDSPSEPHGRAAVITVSTRAASGIYPDEAGPALVERLRTGGFTVDAPTVIPDGRGRVADAILQACRRADVVVTTGGTGLHPNDHTPEGTLDVVERLVPGLAEAMRAAALEATPMGMLSRGVAGICRGTLVLNLPGSPRGAVENLAAVEVVLPHALYQLAGGDHHRGGHQHADDDGRGGSG